MVYSYEEIRDKGYSNYQLQKLVDNNKLVKIKPGIYSTKKEYSLVEVVVKEYKNFVTTLDSALYYYNLIKKEPTYYYLATTQKARKITNPLIKQTFMSENLYQLGVNIIKYQGVQVPAYDIERLLIEVVRNKTKMDYAIYAEAINSYKKISSLLNKRKLDQYLLVFKDPKIQMRIENEIFMIGE